MRIKYDLIFLLAFDQALLAFFVFFSLSQMLRYIDVIALRFGKGKNASDRDN